ncbi:Pseudouridine synthase II [Neofusicoccum parvum]|uniref:Pseudouridine synthase II n=1 Tax=Neofusicoccum parvum TaxID=310453 RepID=A0ACB5SFE9_9PEZI|nr:Pseudouridine synthase II [Neofusicoccum parvum]
MGISSAQVLRDVEQQFNKSALFAPLLAAERAAIEDEKKRNPKYRRARGPNRATRVKLGHGGTLDPLATGVLITGVGAGTKALGRFLGECTKTYEATVLFGCATDTYDNTGKVIRRAPYQHVTKDAVEAALAKYRGPGEQIPPVYSALKFGGKKAYEIMREGGERPEMKPRPVTVHALELVEWMEPGTHAWKFPTEELEASEEEKDAILGVSASNKSEDAQASAGSKRKREEDEAAENSPKKTKIEAGPEPAHSNPDGSSAPAALIRMTVSSGFYVRTLCHDLGIDVGSFGCMTYLVRSEQGEFKLGKNVLEYEELEKGEEVWGPKVQGFLEDWMAREEGKNGDTADKVEEKQKTSRSRSRSPIKEAIS